MKRLMTAAFAITLAAGAGSALADPPDNHTGTPPAHQGGGGQSHQGGAPGGQGHQGGGAPGGATHQGGQPGGGGAQTPHTNAPPSQTAGGQTGHGYNGQGAAQTGHGYNGQGGQTYNGQNGHGYNGQGAQPNNGHGYNGQGGQTYNGQNNHGYNGQNSYQNGHGYNGQNGYQNGHGYNGQGAHGAPGFMPGNHQMRGRDQGRGWYSANRFQHEYFGQRRFRVGAYAYPHGWYEHRWGYGEFLPFGWFGASYYLDSGQYGLPPAPIGCEWVREGGDALLVDVYTGQVLSVYRGIFW